MPESRFEIFKLSDRKIIEAFNAILHDCGSPATGATAIILKDFPQLQVSLSDPDKNDVLREILAADGALVQSWSITFNNVTVSIERQNSADHARVYCQNNLDPKTVSKALAAAHTHLRAYGRTESTDKLLGDELAEFYRKREAALLRLEDVSQNLIIQNDDYRRRVDKEAADHKAKLQATADARLVQLAVESKENEEKLKERNEALDKRTRELDDRSSKHARRQIHKDLKTLLAERNKAFVLSEKTVQKRIPVHFLFGLLIVMTCVVAIRSLFFASSQSEGLTFWIISGRSVMSVIALAAAIIFYIRWNDRWFLRHADEEFRLKRLDLDIDRASWVVELALEWKDEEGKSIPQALLERLTANLFTGDERSEATRHPSEDLASALLGASSSLKLQIPGVGEASLNRRGIQDFKKSAEEAK